MGAGSVWVGPGRTCAGSGTPVGPGSVPGAGSRGSGSDAPGAERVGSPVASSGSSPLPAPSALRGSNPVRVAAALSAADPQLLKLPGASNGPGWNKPCEYGGVRARETEIKVSAQLMCAHSGPR